MDFTGRYTIPAAPGAVWAALNDPAVLKRCIPGCESIEKTSSTEFVAAAILKIGPVRATFKGKVTLSDLDPPHRLLLGGEGQGGVAGFAKGNAEVVLTPEGHGTVLSYTARATVGGKLAQIGQRLIDGAARQIADDFFERFAKAVAPQSAGEAPQAAATIDDAAGSHTETRESSVPTRTRTREGLGPEIWVAGLIAVVLVLLVVFGVLY